VIYCKEDATNIRLGIEYNFTAVEYSIGSCKLMGDKQNAIYSVDAFFTLSVHTSMQQVRCRAPSAGVAVGDKKKDI
jgi:hypothetical protein